MKKKKFNILPAILLTGVILLGLHVNATRSIYRAVDFEDTGKVIFEVESGETASQVGSNLESAGLINSSYGFSSYLEGENLSESIQAGRFSLSPSMTGVEIIEILTNQGAGEIVFTIIEGWTIANIDEALTEEGLIETGEFTACTETCDFSEYTFLPESLEGYLFPDTFFLDASTFSTESFIKTLLDNFKSKTIELTASEERTFEEIIIVASIIEKEVITEEDRAMVSDIIWRRLDAGWMLGMCSTINYITGESEITQEDIATDSPYNTRIYAGLPPTAISNPGLSAIQAAANPETNDYWFFLTATETGETIYAVSNEEHEMNKATYLY